MKIILIALSLVLVLIVGRGFAGEGESHMRKILPGKIKLFNAEKGQYEEVQTVVKTEEQWKKELPNDICYISRGHGTEKPFTGELLHVKENGIFKCAVCGNDLFFSKTKFESGTGWPSFFEPVAEENVGKEVDSSYGMERVEVFCKRCGSHLGHVFPDGPPPSGNRFCINSKALKFKPLSKSK